MQSGVDRLTNLGRNPYNTRSWWRHRQVGKAEACKAFIPGSSPGAASNFSPGRLD